MLCTLSGASGVGKTSLINRLVKDRPGMLRMRSVTTRAPRQSDADGEYLYLSSEEFLRRAAESAFAWTAPFNHAAYGTLVEDLRTALTSEKIYLAAIVPDTVAEVHDCAARLERSKAASSIYILAPRRNLLRERLIKLRGEPPEAVDRKLDQCYAWDNEALQSGLYRLFVQDQDSLDLKMFAIMSVLRYL